MIASGFPIHEIGRRIESTLMTVAYEEIIDFIVDGMSAEAIVSFKPSDETKERLGDLVRRSKTTGLTHAQEAELDTFMQLEHIMRLAKAKARKRLRHE